MKKRRLAICLLALLLVGLLPWQSAYADNVPSGDLSETVSWKFEDGTLTISGEGYMEGMSSSRYPPWYYLREEIKTAIVGEGILNIGARAFADCVNLTQVQLPSTLTWLGTRCFQNCQSLAQIDLPGKITNLDHNVFEGCTALMSITLPNSIRDAEGNTFKDCKSLETVVLSNKLERITFGMFEGCESLKQITLPKSVTRINDSAFRYCYNLTEVEIKGKIKFVGDFGFADCRSLVKLDFPASLEWIGNYAFEGCRSLMEIWFRGDLPDMSGYDVFDLQRPIDDGKCTLYYPVNNKTWTKEMVEKYAGYYHLRLEPYGTPECDHNHEIIPGKEPTCTEEGLTEGKRCTICGKVTQKQEAIPMVEHSFTTGTIPPTCTEEGYDLTVCSVCGLEERSKPTAPTGHRFGVWQIVREPTEKQRGLEARQCLYCTVKEERLTEKLPPAPTEPSPTKPVPAVPPSTHPTETAPQIPRPEPAQRRDAGLAILGVLGALAAAIVLVKRLSGKRN